MDDRSRACLGLFPPAMQHAGNPGLVPSGRVVYDGKRMRKAITRRTIDHSASVMQYLEDAALGRQRLRHYLYSALEPSPAHIINVAPS